ncbi:unnamed protein product [Adineta ricciae]|uniref:Cupin type-1 domain-containing protein n=1 Tax=Adineta ricciae TaxID=249248 RepID=A0A815ARA7_ADIRI|nr:unnamed protein product [Adineta ricciae]
MFLNEKTGMHNDFSIFFKPFKIAACKLLKCKEFKEFPILKGLSMRYVSIDSSSIREPPWHANADELGYCLNGSALITIFSNDNDHNSFLVKQDSGLSGTFFAMTNTVLGNTFQLPSSAFQRIKHCRLVTVLRFKNSSVKNDIRHESEFLNKYHFNAEGLSAKILNSKGIVKTITKNVWPVLKDVPIYSLRITTNGMREPHQHPETAEMGYVIEVCAHMTVIQTK